MPLEPQVSSSSSSRSTLSLSSSQPSSTKPYEPQVSSSSLSTLPLSSSLPRSAMALDLRVSPSSSSGSTLSLFSSVPSLAKPCENRSVLQACLRCHSHQVCPDQQCHWNHMSAHLFKCAQSCKAIRITGRFFKLVCVATLKVAQICNAMRTTCQLFFVKLYLVQRR
jgi:hypothetical protein